MTVSGRALFFPFSHQKRERELTNAINEELRARFDERRAEIFEKRNTMHYLHGTHWSLSASSDEDDFSPYKTMSAESTLWHRDVIDHDVSILDAYISKMINEMHKSVFSDVFETIHQSTAQTGNVVKRTEDLAADMMQMLEKIKLGSDRHGRPSTPQFHGPQQLGVETIKQMKAQPPEYERKWNSLMAEKEKTATKEEAERIKKFRLR